MTKIAKVDPVTCIGCNTCALIDEATFEMDMENYKAIVKKNAPTPSSKTEEARDGCPVNAISIVEQ